MKKWLALVLASLLVLSTMAAFAAVTPSKSTGDLTKIDTASITTSTGAAVADDFVVGIPEEEPAKTTEIVEKLFDTTTKGGAPIDYFPAGIQKDIAAKLPEGYDLKTLDLNEIIALVIENYDEAYGDIDIVFNFGTLYKEDQDVFAVLGNYTEAKAADEKDADYTSEDGVEWILLDAEPQEDGAVKITFTGDAMKAAEAADSSTLALLNTK